MPSLHRTVEADITGGGPSKHVDSLHSKSVLPSHSGSKHRWWRAFEAHSARTPLVAPTPSLTAEANIASGEPHPPIVAPTPSLASGEPINLRAAESRRLMLLSRASDSASSVFLRLTMYADPLAECVWSRLGGTHTSRSGTVDARPQGTP